MSADCLFELQGNDSYVDCLWISGISIGLLFGQFLITAPLIKPIVTVFIEMVKERMPSNVQQPNNEQQHSQPLLNAADITDTKQEMEQRIAIFWKDYKRQFKVFGFNFNGYIILITMACFFVNLGTIGLIYSVDDPRTVWRNEGWKKSINGSVMLIVIIGGSNGVMLGATKKSIKNVLLYYKSTKVTDAFHLIYWISALSTPIFFCIYYPYIVCYLLLCAFTLAVCIGILVTCGGCFTFCCAYLILYAILNLFVTCLLVPLKCCVSEKKHQLVTDLLVFLVLYVAMTYGMMVALQIIVFAVTGGIDNADLCINDNVESWLSLLSLYCGPIFAAIGFLYKCCTCIRSHSGSMELKDEYVNNKEEVNMLKYVDMTEPEPVHGRDPVIVDQVPQNIMNVAIEQPATKYYEEKGQAQPPTNNLMFSVDKLDGLSQAIGQQQQPEPEEKDPDHESGNGLAINAMSTADEMNEVQCWLNNCGMGELFSVFEGNGLVEMETVILMDRNDLSALGLNMGLQLKCVKEIGKYVVAMQPKEITDGPSDSQPQPLQI